VVDLIMDNVPRRHPTYSFFLTKEQVELLLKALGTMECAESQAEAQVRVEIKRELRQKLINLQGAIKRRESENAKVWPR